jgi:hypothetical protein
MVKVEHKTNKGNFILKVSEGFVEFYDGKADVNEVFAKEISEMKNYQLVKPESKPMRQGPEEEKPKRKPRKPRAKK